MADREPPAPWTGNMDVVRRLRDERCEQDRANGVFVDPVFAVPLLLLSSSSSSSSSNKSPRLRGEDDSPTTLGGNVPERDSPATQYRRSTVAFLREMENSLILNTRMYDPEQKDWQSDINLRMRRILIDWLVEVNTKFKYHDETLHLTASIIDQFMTRRPNIPRTDFQLVGVAAHILAAKMEEIHQESPDTYSHMCSGCYTAERVQNYELIMLQALDHHVVTSATALKFLPHFLEASEAAGGDAGRLMGRIRSLAHYVADRVLYEGVSLKYHPSCVASCCVYLARKDVLRGCSTTADAATAATATAVVWTAQLRAVTGRCEAELFPCLRDMAPLLRGESPPPKQVTKIRKDKIPLPLTAVNEKHGKGMRGREHVRRDRREAATTAAWAIRRRTG